MGPIFLFLSFGLVVAQFCVPRRHIFTPLVIATFLVPNLLTSIGGLGFSACRLVIIAGIIRAVTEGQFIWRRRNSIDFAVLCWAILTLLSAFFHHQTREENPMIVRLSLVYEIVGCYLFARAYLRGFAEFDQLIKCIAVVAIPLAFVMLFEFVSHRSLYGLLGAQVGDPWVREGKYRINGPFASSILAGSAGATTGVMLLQLLWSPKFADRRLGKIGLFACLVTIYCCSSSGPIIAFVSGLVALSLWRLRKDIGRIRTGIICVLIALHLIMEAPVWYLISRIDIVGGSSSWGRAELITQALNHVSEWWFMGTDYTRHWMPYGIEWSESHTDITNYYIKMGVIGGLPLMLAFILILFRAYQALGRAMRTRGIPRHLEFILWCMGSTLFAYAVNFMSISYYDQNYVLVMLLIGAIPGAALTVARVVRPSGPAPEHQIAPSRVRVPIPADVLAG